MSILALIFLIIVGIVYALAVHMVTAARYEEIERRFGLSDYYPNVEVEDKYFIPAIVGAVIVSLWCLILKEPYMPIKDLTPSYVTSGWLWSTIAAYLACIPFGLTLGFLIFILPEVQPESKGMLIAVIISCLVAIVYQAMLLFKVYSPGLIWLPMLSTTPLVMVIKKWLPDEMENLDEGSSSGSVSSGSGSIGSTSWSGNSTSGAGSRSVSRSSSSSQPSSSSDDDYRRQEKEYQKEQYYYQYERYRDEAERLESEAESNDRWAEDNEYWARESNDSWKAEEARRDRERANRLRYQSREARRQADRYYNLYNSCR